MSSKRDEMLFELEQQLAQVGRKLSAEDASSLIAEDFVEFGASGKVWSKTEIIASMSQWPPIERIVENFSVRELSDSVCLVTYKSVGVKGQASPFSLRSSIWRHTGERWQIVFHQGTNVIGTA
jgi:Uncharacterized protein conserved in bacteria